MPSCRKCVHMEQPEGGVYGNPGLGLCKLEPPENETNVGVNQYPIVVLDTHHCSHFRGKVSREDR